MQQGVLVQTADATSLIFAILALTPRPEAVDADLLASINSVQLILVTASNIGLGNSCDVDCNIHNRSWLCSDYLEVQHFGFGFFS